MSFNIAYFIVIILICNHWKNPEAYAIPAKNEELKSQILKFNSENRCTSTKCTDESTFYLNNMDHNVDPCYNFYSFACGGFLKKTSISEEEFIESQYGKLNKKIQDGLINELKSGPQSDDLEAYRKIKKFYINCVNQTRIEKDGMIHVSEFLEKLGGWPVLSGDKWKEDDYRWENTVSLISKAGLLPDFPFNIDVVYDTNSTKYVVDVRGVRLEVDNSYNMSDDNSKHYINFMTEVAVLLGANNETAFNEMRECLQFELKLFKAVYDIDYDMNNDLQTEKKKSMKIWTTEYPDIPWLNLFNMIFNPSNVTITEDDILLIHDSQYVSEIGKLLNNTSKRTLANHQIWRVLYYYIMKFTPKKLRNRYETFKELISEKDKTLSRENECLNILQELSPVALNSLYIKKFLNKRGKSEQLYILENVKNEARKYFTRLGWMDDDLRRMTLEKLETVTAFIDYPEELLNNSKVEYFYKDSSIILGSPLYSYLNITRAEKNFSLRMLRYPRRENDWAKNTNVARVSANYDSDNHRINIAAGMLQSPFFDVDRPKYLNYGGIGFPIGHEIIHGIDASDAKDNHFFILKNSIIEEYNKRAKCLVDQFSNYTISEAYGNVDGERTYSENIADGGGFKLGYYAYTNWVKTTNTTEEMLPGLNYTPQQMYWISIASILCSKIKDVPLPAYIRGDDHSPDEARINVGFSNVDEFAKDFNCPVGSKMNPVQKCVVW